MLNELIGERFASKDNFLTRIDARIKMFFVFASIIIIIFSRSPQLPACVAFLCAVFLLIVRVPPAIIFFRLAAPVAMASVIVLIQILFYGVDEGISRGFLILGKVAGCASLIIFLTLTTPINLILNGARWFRLPKTFIEITAISYRYIFVLIEDAATIRDAQKVRLGYNGMSRSLRSFSELAGSVFIRAYDQSISTFQAMELRGYCGANKAYFEEGFKFKDGLHIIIFLAILCLMAGLING